MTDCEELGVAVPTGVMADVGVTTTVVGVRVGVAVGDAVAVGVLVGRGVAVGWAAAGLRFTQVWPGGVKDWLTARSAPPCSA